jgi:hypothetical protein
MSNENIDMGIVQGALPVIWGRVFALKVSDGHLVRWSTFREINSGHFIVERKRSNEDLFTAVSGLIPSAGNINEEQWYEFTDTDVRQAGRYVYRIRQVDRDGTFSYSQEVSLMVDENLQVDVYPNPTATDATVEIRLEADAEISVMLFGSEGKHIKTIKEKVLFEKGKVSIPIMMNDLAQGVYTVVIQIGGTRLEKRLVKVVR